MFSTGQYSWSDVDITLLGRVVAGARGVMYEGSQEKEVVHGRGNEPMSIVDGNKTYTGELKILQSELEKLQEAAGAASINDIPYFDIIITYKPRRASKLTTDIVKFAEFNKITKQINQNDKFMEVTLPFIALGIQYNV